MIRRLYPTKDAFVTNLVLTSGTTAVSSSTGASEILQLFKLASGGPQFGHIVTHFGTIPAVSGAQYVLHLSDAPHSGTLPNGYKAYVYPNAQTFAEGPGHDLDTFLDLGTCNWFLAAALSPWTVPGAYPPSGTANVQVPFDTGHEDMNADVTALVPSASFGFYIQLDPALEADTNDYYVKMFHSRQTHFPDRLPYLEIRWDDHTASLSTAQQFMVTGTVWSGTLIDPSQSGSLPGFLTSTFVTAVDPTGTLDVRVADLRNLYRSEETVTLHLDIRPRDYNPSAVASASSVTSSAALTQAWYRVVDDFTDEDVVPFGTGSFQHTRLSYGDAGNWFRFDMSALPTGTVFRFEFVYQIGSDRYLVPGTAFKFRVM